MTSTSLLFDINELNAEQQIKFHTVYNELKPTHTSYLQYKLNLPRKIKLDSEEEENEWCYELYRYLRARKWNVKYTIKSVSEMIQWRIDNNVDSILEHQSIIHRVDLIRRIIPNAHHGYTKTHQPLYIEKTGQMHVNQVLNEYTTEELMQCHIYWLEFNCERARERSRQLGKHVETFAMIHDLKGMKMKTRKLIPFFKQCLYIDDNYYAERLGHLFIINPPKIFPALWNLLKHVIDPVTKSKIIVIKKGSDTSPVLLQYINSDQLPREYGGNCQSCPTSPDCIPIYDQKQDSDDDNDDDE
ncbi:unnamed protein product [Rotaria sp. Silwood1]|nr:unnamed protein product [Rotaria sp. Silwood1]